MIACNVSDYIVIMRITLSTEQCGWLVREVLCKPLLDRQTADRVLVVSSRIPLAEFLATVAHHGGGTLHSHSIISEPLNRLFNLWFCPPQRPNTVRHTVETDRWRAIDPDRSRTTPKHTLSYSLFPDANTFTPRPVLPSSTKSFTVERTPKKPAGAQLI
jgi:hypothetical protein